MAHVVETLDVLLSTHNAEQRIEADRWLRQWQKSKNSWDDAFMILSTSQNHSALLFASQTIRNKMKFDFAVLPESCYTMLCQQLIQNLTKFQNVKPIFDLLGLALTHLLLQSGDTWTDPLQVVLQFSKTSTPNLTTHLIHLLAEESWSGRFVCLEESVSIFKERLRSVFPTVLIYLKELKASQNGVWNEESLKCLRAWIRLLDVSEFNSDFMAVFDDCFKILLTPLLPDQSSQDLNCSNSSIAVTASSLILYVLRRNCGKQCSFNSLMKTNSLNQVTSTLFSDSIRAALQSCNHALLYHLCCVVTEVARCHYDDILQSIGSNLQLQSLVEMWINLLSVNWYDLSLEDSLETINWTTKVSIALNNFVHHKSKSDFQCPNEFYAINERILDIIITQCQLPNDITSFENFWVFLDFRSSFEFFKVPDKLDNTMSKAVELLKKALSTDTTPQVKDAALSVFANALSASPKLAMLFEVEEFLSYANQIMTESCPNSIVEFSLRLNILKIIYSIIQAPTPTLSVECVSSIVKFVTSQLLVRFPVSNGSVVGFAYDCSLPASEYKDFILELQFCSCSTFEILMGSNLLCANYLHIFCEPICGLLAPHISATHEPGQDWMSIIESIISTLFLTTDTKYFLQSMNLLLSSLVKALNQLLSTENIHEQPVCHLLNRLGCCFKVNPMVTFYWEPNYTCDEMKTFVNDSILPLCKIIMTKFSHSEAAIERCLRVIKHTFRAKCLSQQSVHEFFTYFISASQMYPFSSYFYAADWGLRSYLELWGSPIEPSIVQLFELLCQQGLKNIALHKNDIDKIAGMVEDFFSMLCIYIEICPAEVIKTQVIPEANALFPFVITCTKRSAAYSVLKYALTAITCAKGLECLDINERSKLSVISIQVLPKFGVAILNSVERESMEGVLYYMIEQFFNNIVVKLSEQDADFIFRSILDNLDPCIFADAKVKEVIWMRLKDGMVDGLIQRCFYFKSRFDQN